MLGSWVVVVWHFNLDLLLSYVSALIVVAEPAIKDLEFALCLKAVPNEVNVCCEFDFHDVFL
jgi:hypothetical protein